jgi:predicted nucleic acid-binding protein
MPELTPRVVFDCNLFVQGIANRNSPARKALRLFFNGDISLFVSEPIIREVRDVLNRAEVRRQLPGINDRIVNAFLTKLEAMYINLTLVSNAAYLVSRDKDLLGPNDHIDRHSPTVPFMLSIPANYDSCRLCYSH